MSSKRYHETETEDNDMTNIIQKEIQQLKQDVSQNLSHIQPVKSQRMIVMFICILSFHNVFFHFKKSI